MSDIATQKLPRGVSHNVGAHRYEKEMPLSLFQKLPEKIQEKIKAGLKREEVAAAAIVKSNEAQAGKTTADQAEVTKEKAAEEKKKPGRG